MEHKNTPFQRNPELAARMIGDELILVPIKGQLAQLQQIYVLNEVGAFIWEHLDEMKDPAGLSDQLATVFEVDPEEAEADLEGYLRELSAQGLLLPVEMKAP